jgi:hypothetical protein
MTIRTTALRDTLTTLRTIARTKEIRPARTWKRNQWDAETVHGVTLRDSLFSSPWWGQSSGSSFERVSGRAGCLAGAYAEMLENISCDIWYPDWLSCRREITPLWDEQRVTTEECARTLPPGSGVRRTVEARRSLEMHRVHPYINVTASDDHLLFPREIGLEVVGRNNGGAVGFHPQEAIVAALLEIFERYALRKFALGVERFPLIDPREFEGTPAEQIAASLANQGHETFYLDMSLGGRLPVIGILLLNPVNDTMSIAAAGGVDPLQATEHCLREMLCDAYYSDRLKGWPPAEGKSDLLKAWARSGFTRGWGGSLAQVDFQSGYSAKFKRAFEARAESNEELLRTYVQVCRSFGSEVHARDCSILGLSAFHVYAGRLSEYSFVAHEGLLTEGENASALAAMSRDRWLHDYLPVLDRCRAGHCGEWTVLNELLNNPFAGYPEEEDVCDYFSWPVASLASPERGITLCELVSGLAFHAGAFTDAAKLWRRAAPDRSHRASIGHFLDLAARSPNLATAKQTFAAAFGRPQLTQVEGALALPSLLRFPLCPAGTEIEERWLRFRQDIYPRPGQWHAKNTFGC